MAAFEYHRMFNTDDQWDQGGSRAVSYTHLDVYKRQPTNNMLLPTDKL